MIKDKMDLTIMENIYTPIDPINYLPKAIVNAINTTEHIQQIAAFP